MAWFAMVWLGIKWFGMLWHGMLWLLRILGTWLTSFIFMSKPKTQNTCFWFACLSRGILSTHFVVTFDKFGGPSPSSLILVEGF